MFRTLSEDSVKIVVVLPDSLLTLSFSHFGLLVPLGHDVLKCGTDDGPLELLRPLRTLLGGLLFNALLVLPSVEHSPGHLSGVPLEKMGLVASAIKKLENLKQKSEKVERTIQF